MATNIDIQEMRRSAQLLDKAGSLTYMSKLAFMPMGAPQQAQQQAPQDPQMAQQQDPQMMQQPQGAEMMPPPGAEMAPQQPQGSGMPPQLEQMLSELSGGVQGVAQKVQTTEEQLNMLAERVQKMESSHEQLEKALGGPPQIPQAMPQAQM
ncbi:MAG: hypothetical protein RR382_00450 [Tannerellaceae bacterium]